ncbi:hypothetical protein JCM12294_44840 [Desulfocicer niacini]
MKSTIARIEANFNSFFEVMVLASSLIGKAVNSANDDTLNSKLTIPERDNIQVKNIFGFKKCVSEGLTFVGNAIGIGGGNYRHFICPWKKPWE